MFSTALITTTQATTALTTVIDQLKADLPTLLIVLAALVALSFVLALLDYWTQMRWLDNYSKRWK